MNRDVSENDQVPWPLGQWRWQLADDSIDMQYTYVGIVTRQFTYQFLGTIFRVRHIWRVTWKAVKLVLVFKISTVCSKINCKNTRHSVILFPLNWTPLFLCHNQLSGWETTFKASILSATQLTESAKHYSKTDWFDSSLPVLDGYYLLLLVDLRGYTTLSISGRYSTFRVYGGHRHVGLIPYCYC